jgi:hypothetical protein
MAFFSKNRDKTSGKKEKDCEQPEQKDWWYPITMFGGTLNFFGNNYLEAYKRIPQVRMVIDKRAACLSSAVPYILDKDENEPQTKDAKNIRKLFDNANFIQSFSELYVLKEIYRLIYGWSAIYLFRAFDNAAPVAMFAIPPSMLNFRLKKEHLLFNQIDETNIVDKITVAGTTTEIKFSDLIFFRDEIPNTENPLISDSKMQSVINEYELARAISEAEKTIVERRGALGILSKDIDDPNSIGVFEDERQEIQKKYKEAYGLRMSKDQIIITTMALKWQQMSLSVKDLMLIELGEEAQKRIAGVYNVPYNLLPGGSDSTFNNQDKAIKYLYTEAIQTSNSDAKKFTNAILEQYGLHLKLDYSDLQMWQEDARQQAAAMNTAIAGLNAAFTAGNITREEWRLNASRYIDIDPNKNIQS